MNMKTTALCGALLLLPSFALQVHGDTTGSIGIASDYFWRGVSQNAGNPALSVGAEVKENGFYAGFWGSQVDYGDDASVEYDLYAGYALSLTDDLSVTGGMIQYNWDAGYDDVEELFAKASYKNVNVAYYVDIDDSAKSYVEASIGIPFIEIIDVSIGYGEMKGGMNHTSLMASKDLGDYTIGLMVHEGVQHGKATDSAALTFVYNF